MNQMKEEIFAQLREAAGKVGFYYKNLATGETWSMNPRLPLVAASVIKIPVLIDVFTELEQGKANKDEIYRLREEDKLPSCGALNYMHTGLEVTVEDLYTLMIILSDNTATNILIKKFGMQNINACIRALGLEVTSLNRLLFDSKASAAGIENYICAEEMGLLLESMYRGTMISAKASEKMLGILKNQRLNGKIPFCLKGYKIAHKTGEDDGITHDVGIVYAPQPFVVCFCSNETDVPQFERTIQQVSKQLCEMQAKA